MCEMLLGENGVEFIVCKYYIRFFGLSNKL